MSHDPLTDPHGHYTDSYGPVLGPQLAIAHIAVDDLTAQLEEAKIYLQTLQHKANFLLSRGELPRPPVPVSPVHILLPAPVPESILIPEPVVELPPVPMAAPVVPEPTKSTGRGW